MYLNPNGEELSADDFSKKLKRSKAKIVKRSF